MTMTIKQAKSVLKEVIRYNMRLGEKGAPASKYIVMHLEGPPGMGKTSAAYGAAAELGLGTDTYVPAGNDPTDFTGLPNFSTTDAGQVITKWTTTEMFLNPDGTVIVLDELTKAAMMVLNVFSQLIEERRIGKHVLPPKTTIVTTGNPLSSRSGDQEMPRHLDDRLCVVPVINPYQDWLEWAATGGIRTEYTGYVAFKGEASFGFNPDNRKNPTQRSITKASGLLELDVLPRHLLQQMTAGYVGDGAATEIMAFLQLHNDLPSPQSIIADPENSPVPPDSNPGMIYAIVSALVGHATVKTIKPIMAYLSRIKSKEFTVYGLKDIIHRYPALNSSPALTEWKFKNSHLFTPVL